jgi:hypothetical protein
MLPGAFRSIMNHGLKIIHLPALPDGCIGVPTSMYEQMQQLPKNPAPDPLINAVNTFAASRCNACGGTRHPISGDIEHAPDCLG